MLSSDGGPSALKIAIFILALGAMGFMGKKGAGPSEMNISCRLVRPEEIVKALSDPKAENPVLVHVGFRNFYRAAHIPGSRYAGPASNSGGVELLKKEARAVPRDQAIVVYCGCCPMEHCPNIRPACTALKEMGFARVRVLDLPQSFEDDWIDKGYPIEKGDSESERGKI